jgi:hypothetical protein
MPSTTLREMLLAEYVHALAHAFPRCRTQSGSTGLWLVPPAVALCHTRRNAPGQTRHHGISGNGVSLAPRDALGVETRQARGQRC